MVKKLVHSTIAASGHGVSQCCSGRRVRVREGRVLDVGAVLGDGGSSVHDEDTTDAESF